MSHFRPHYSGHLSKNFWARVAAIKDPVDHPAIYALGVMLQNSEEYVLRQLAQAELTQSRKSEQTF
jgi:hypothetical protein